jgi:hypothetical protein
MKRLLLLLALSALIFIGCGVPSDSKYQIKVSGTAGLEFSGSYMVVTTEGKSTSKSVDGRVPASYTVEGHIVSVVFQKKGDIGFLKVEILKNGEAVGSESTTADYGLVTVATN